MPKIRVAMNLFVLLFVVGVMSMSIPKQKVFAASPAWNAAFTRISDPSGGISNPNTFVYRLEVTLFGMAGAITFIASIVSGIKYMAARSDPKATMQAKQALTYSIVGLILVVTTYTIRSILLSLGT